MRIFSLLTALLLMSGSVVHADDAGGVSVATSAAAASASGTASAVMPSSALPHNSRAIVLVIGVAAVLVTFQRAFTSPRKSA